MPLIPATIFITLCVEACDAYYADMVEAGYYKCECESEEHGWFEVFIDHYYVDASTARTLSDDEGRGIPKSNS